MALFTITSPHTHNSNSTSKVMLTVALATVPGILVLTGFFGWGTLINIGLAMLCALAFESLILKIRKRPLGFYLKDGSALLTALLLGLALPPFTPYWVTIIAVGFAIVFAKQLYGGLGQNPFNPAMAGYALVLVSFPVQLTTTWALSTQMSGHAVLGFLETLEVIFKGLPVLDGFTGATPLDSYKNLISSNTTDTAATLDAFNGWLNGGWEWANLAFLAGGLYLLYKRIITWHIPVSMLLALSLCSLFIGWDQDLYTPLSLHLLSGATMLGAFFIATDPVSASSTPRGKLIYGAGVGILLYVIRTWGTYPDAVAFAVLLMNFAVPLIDSWTQPRTYGHRKAKRGLPPKTN